MCTRVIRYLSMFNDRSILGSIYYNGRIIVCAIVSVNLSTVRDYSLLKVVGTWFPGHGGVVVIKRM